MFQAVHEKNHNDFLNLTLSIYNVLVYTASKQNCQSCSAFYLTCIDAQ